MVKIKAVGIIFPNTYDGLIPELISRRTMASVPFAARYRMIDFCLSGMVNAGIENVTVVVKKNYHSLMDHLGNGREWDLARKRGGLNIVPPFARNNKKMYHGRVEALHSILGYLSSCKEKYVIISDCNVASSLDFAHLLDTHVESGANVTVVYERTQIPQPLKSDNYTLSMDENNRVTGMRMNDFRDGVQNLSMNIIVMEREELILMVKEAMSRNLVHFERDILAGSLSILDVRGYECTGYRGRIYDMASYFAENMRLLNPASIEALFPLEHAVYTKVRDEAPARYGMYSKVSNCMVADGCIIEGTAENCVLFRGVKIAKGATVKNCILMQGTTVESGAEMNYVVTDKDVKVTESHTLTGAPTCPMFVPKGSTV